MRKKLVEVLTGSVVLIIIIILWCNLTVSHSASGRLYCDVDSIPHNRYGLLLGTSPITRSGIHNYYFDNRVNAAAQLFKAGKIDYIIASGGDYTKTEKYGCDEPRAMRDSLIKHGVSSSRIILDYDGIRTIRSIAKAKEVYGIDSLTIISQKYHNERAIYQAGHFGIEAQAYNAVEPPIRYSIIKNHIREYFARVKVFIDLFVH